MRTTFNYFILFLFVCVSMQTQAQEIKVTLDFDDTHQTFEGFGAALAFYEGWLTAHPNKDEIYEIIFDELNLDILRVRNAHGYDATMVGKVKEYIDASEEVRGQPIPFLSTSWGPPAELKSNNDKNNGGTLKYTVDENGNVTFAYDEFANWWNESLDEYEENGIYPTYVSIQNEPDFEASYESCLLDYTERANATDTIAGYNKALVAVDSAFSTRTNKPKLLGPETIGLGYNTFRYYSILLDTSLIYGLAHHLYHGVEAENPWTSSYMAAAGDVYPEKPHFQTEYSLDECDWFNTSGMIYKSLVDENAAAYFYWDLVWPGKIDGVTRETGLVAIDNPWTTSSWSNEKGFYRNKVFYTFKQFSAFIHPGWQRITADVASSDVEVLAFISPAKDSLSIVAINRSETAEKTLRFMVDDFNYYQSGIYTTNDTDNCDLASSLDDDAVYTVAPHSVNTAFFTKTFPTGNKQQKVLNSQIHVYPNPFTNYIQISGKANSEEWTLYSIDGSIINSGYVNNIDCSALNKGMYILKVNNQAKRIVKQ